MAKKASKSARVKGRSEAKGLDTAEIGGVKIRVARTAPKTAKARRIRGAVQAYYG